MENNIRTMKFVCEDNFGNYVYKCIETDVLYKDVAPQKQIPELYSCGNEIDGDPCYPIKSDCKINFIDREILNKADEFTYMMLGRLKSDCEYFLGCGNRCEGHLWAKNANDQIIEMKKLYDSLSADKKPEWLTYEKILEYEKEMIK
jgi:hypothetical protein